MIEESPLYPRQFYITNSDNERIELNNKSSFGYDPKGLGVELNYTLYSGMHGSTIAETNYANQDISFNMIYGYESQNYQTFYEFASAISRPPLKLHYIIPGVGEFERKVVLKQLSKTEVDHTTSHILSTLEFTPLSPWYKWKVLKPEYTQGNYENSKGYYDRTNASYYAYDYTYNIAHSSSGWNMIVNNESIVPGGERYTGLKFVFHADTTTGAIYHPEFSILDMDYNAIQTERLLNTIQMGQTLTIDTAYGEEEYTITDTTGAKVDCSQYIDPTVRGFAQFPVGKSVFKLGEPFQKGITGITAPNVGIYIMEEWGVV